MENNTPEAAMPSIKQSLTDMYNLGIKHCLDHIESIKSADPITEITLKNLIDTLKTLLQ